MIPQHRLRVVRKADLDLLISRTKDLLPESIFVYGWLTMQKEFGKLANSATVAYIPEQNIPFFIVITPISGMEQQNVCPFWKAGSIAHEDIVDLLKSIPKFNWKADIFLSRTCSRVLEELHVIMRTKDLSGDSLFLKEKHIGHSYILNLKKIISIETPEDVVIAKLQPSDVSHVYGNWEHQDLDTKDTVEGYMSTYPSFGAFVRSENADGNQEWQLASWIIAKNDAQMGMTHTYPQYRKRKLASIVTHTLVKEICDRKLLPYVLIEDTNTASIMFHQKLGFEQQAACGWEMFASRETI